MASPQYNPRESGSNAPRPSSPYARTQASVTDVTAKPAEAIEAVPREQSKLTVGPRIKLKGLEITDCDTLLVEGSVEASMDSRVMDIAESGSYKGAAQVDVAEIRGRFEGELTARKKLIVYATGRVTGQVRYSRLVIEEGGQLQGQVQSGLSAPSPGSPPSAD